ncbi:MAG TPA: hypothetical protein ENH40_04940 [Nitrospirae bacterium]|nr:hypothetical protein [Nitrospirota bacterium]
MMEWLTKLLTKLFGKNGMYVLKDTCMAIQKANDQAHDNLEDCIEGAERRTQEKFEELKTDMRLGFTEVKQLIRDK